MKFELMPLLEKMEEFYLLPRSKQRFPNYLNLLLDKRKEDIELPIAAFNPLGTELVLKKLRELIQLGAEPLIGELIDAINPRLLESENRKIHLALNLVDDIGGAWSHKYTTDFSSKFDFGSVLKRNFCLPYFWTSEPFSPEMVVKRAQEYLYRTVYRLENKKPETLREHLYQEVAVQIQVNSADGSAWNRDFTELMEKRLKDHGDSTDYGRIFNFFYGDEACATLGYPTYGFPKNAGFHYAVYLASQKE